MSDKTESTYMITTSDNPYNYFTHFVEWFQWDTQSGYNTLNYLARVVRSSPELPESMEEIAINNAIDEILKENITGVYVKVFKTSDSTPTEPKTKP